MKIIRRFAAVLLCLPLMAQASTIEMKVFGMVCGYCAQGIEKSLRSNAATADVVVSLEHKLVVVRTHEGQDIADDELRSLISKAGYDLKSIRRTERAIAEVRNDISKAQP